MSAEPKRVELTEAEIDALVNVIGDVCSHTGPVVPSLPWGCPDCDETVRTYLAGTIERIVAAREAAARREALLEAAEEFEEDAADAWGGNAPWMTSGVRVANLAAEWLRESAAALAEPERDEEGGMPGGSPNFKHRDATVPMDDDFPSEVARALLDDERLSDEEGGNDD